MKVAQISLVLSYLCTIQCKMKPFLIDGIEASIKKFPHVAYLSIRCKEFEGLLTFMCGSSILNQNIALTAAHCIYDCLGDISVILSAGNSNKRKGTLSTVVNFYKHEQFNSFTLSFDICVMKLKTPLMLNANVQRVVLMRDPPYNEEAEVAGWGFTNELENKKSNILLSIKQYVIERDECQDLLDNRLRRHVGVLCAKSNDSSHTAKGDSGSALVVRGYIQIGIVSYKLTNTTQKTKTMGVYTDVGYLFDWIVQTSEDLMCASE